MLILNLFLIAFLQVSDSQTTADPALAAEIAKIRAIDNHGHPLKVVAEGAKPDEDYDALTFEEFEPFPTPVRIRPDNPEFIAAWKTLYGYPYSDMSPEHVKELLEMKKRVMRQHGEGYPAWVLDKLGIETALANRAAMGAGLAAPRFRWVSMIDALIFPLNNAGLREENPDYHSFFVGEDRLLKRYLTEAGVKVLPSSLDRYLAQVVTPTLERQKREGALGVKFEAAYLRSLDFEHVPQPNAAQIYARYVQGGQPPAAEYKRLQDFLAFYIAREAGRLGLAVHFHVCGGAGGYYKLSGTNPLLLEPMLNDPALRKTNFVLIHGGWPNYTKEVAFLLTKPNVYTDTSAMSFVLYPRALSEVLRYWIELMPEKVLFGTDVEPFMPEINWEETGWLTTNTVREALSLALTGMMNDGEISRARALEVARLVMRENARKLYGLP